MTATTKSPKKCATPKSASATSKPQSAPQTKSNPASQKSKPNGQNATQASKPAAAPKKLAALDAAAKVLAEAKAALTTGQMIEQMAAKGYWTSPGGKTPAATLYSAILRELKAKGPASRFTKADRGKFALKK